MSRLFGMSADFLEEMVESAHDGLLLLDNNTIVGCNPAACTLYGLTPAELIGCHPGLLSPEFQPDGIASEIKAELYMSGAISGQVQKFLWQHLRKNGEPFTAEVTLNPARSDTNNNQQQNAKFVAIVRDVTQEQQTAAKLHESEIRFRHLFEKSPIPMLLTDGQLVNDINTSFKHIFGLSFVHGTRLEKWKNLLFSDDASTQHFIRDWYASLGALQQKDSVFLKHIYHIKGQRKQKYYFQIGLASVGNEILVSFNDLTEQLLANNKLEELNKALESKVQERTTNLENALNNLKSAQAELVRAEKLASLGALVAGVAHELNTPIGNALMVSSVIKQNIDQLHKARTGSLSRSEFERHLNNITDSADIMQRNLSRTAELIVSFKQVAIDQTTYQRRTFQLHEVIHEVLLTIGPTIKRNNIRLLENIGADIRMDSYPGPLGQVLINLVNNAVTHAFNGQSERLIEITGRHQDEHHVQLEVTDNGCGIDPKNLAKIFDPFFTTKFGQGGSGIGLYIVYSMIHDLFGGTIEVSSTVQNGTTMRITLPKIAD